MKRKYLPVGFICAALSVICAVMACRNVPAENPVNESREEIVSEISAAVSASADVESGSSEQQAESAAEPEAEEVSAAPYESPVDFASLWEVNQDVYAWLDIPGTEISYPVAQHPEEDEYYLRRDLEGNYSSEGTLFTEKTYNGTDFSDPATIIYGHQMQSGTMFGKLQEIYSDPASFDAHQEIIIYLPEEEKHYAVFASVPYDKWHILYNYDFSDPEMFQAFLDKIYATRSLNAVFSQSAEISADDRLLILSTCLKGDSNKRYLVLAVLQD